MKVKVYTSEEVRAMLLETRGWTFSDDNWSEALRLMLGGRELTPVFLPDGTVKAAEILDLR
jgi:hypothetical protein